MRGRNQEIGWSYTEYISVNDVFIYIKKGETLNLEWGLSIGLFGLFYCMEQKYGH